MGLIRKTISASSMGVVDWRSDKERIAGHTKGTKKAVKAQTRALKQIARREQQDRKKYFAGL